jgi:hypothetical protein
MQVFILGLGKSGTTALLQKVAAGLPDCVCFSGGPPGKYLDTYPNAVYKHIFKTGKPEYLLRYQKHMEDTPYDRRIWMARDPRDIAVSRMLYRWHRGYRGRKKQFDQHLEMVRKKEQNPQAIPFHAVCRYASFNEKPMSTEEVIERERIRYERTWQFVSSLDANWHMYRFELMIEAEFSSLNEYLGFQVAQDAEVDRQSRKSKVVRRKGSGDWRNWFTEQDIELYRPIYEKYMNFVGYESNDWELNDSPTIQSQYSSQYMISLPKKRRRRDLKKLYTKASRILSRT